MDLLAKNAPRAHALVDSVVIHLPLAKLYAQLVLSALLPIYSAAYASLSRPSSAAKAVRKKRKDGRDSTEALEDSSNHMEGLSTSDAIALPVFAGLTLSGLYFLIQWLENPELLNKIINGYFAIFSIASTARFFSDSLDVLHSLIFPMDFIDQGELFHNSYEHRQAFSSTSRRTRSLPLPGPVSRLPLPNSVLSLPWFLYRIPYRQLRIKCRVRNIVRFDAKLGIHGIEGLVAGFAIVAYYNLVRRPWWMTNLLGLSFAYSALQLMSPTTFRTANIILWALFAYDIYFVFYTPMMETVAKSLDAPVKLVFPRPAAADEDPLQPTFSALGLGDIVLPGMIMGLALRFDWFLHYLRKTNRPKNETSAELSQSSLSKPTYESPFEAWGEYLWCSRIVCRILSPRSTPPIYTARNDFSTPYFRAALMGYFSGMVATFTALTISNRPQPALLYLVPGVCGALWFSAWWRGEVKLMLSFTDDTAEAEKADATSSVANTGKSSEQSKTDSDNNNNKSALSGLDESSFTQRAECSRENGSPVGESTVSGKNSEKQNTSYIESERMIFYFSIELPPTINSATIVSEEHKHID